MSENSTISSTDICALRAEVAALRKLMASEDVVGRARALASEISRDEISKLSAEIEALKVANQECLTWGEALSASLHRERENLSACQLELEASFLKTEDLSNALRDSMALNDRLQTLLVEYCLWY